MPYIQIHHQLSRALACLQGGAPLKESLVLVALLLNELNIRDLPATSLTSRYNLLLKELGALEEEPSEQAIEALVNSMSEEQHQALYLALLALHEEAQLGEVFS
jgi:hypothetical protein